MATILFMQGLPGSGKSTLAKKIQAREQDKDWVILSLDNFRAAIGTKWSKEKEQLVKYLYHAAIVELLQQDRNIILDNTHLQSKAVRRTHATIGAAAHVTYYYYKMDTSLEECLERNSKRKGDEFVPEQAIKDMANISNVPDLSKFAYEYRLAEVPVINIRC